MALRTSERLKKAFDCNSKSAEQMESKEYAQESVESSTTVKGQKWKL